MFALKRTSLGSVLDCVAPCLEESLMSLAKLRLDFFCAHAVCAQGSDGHKNVLSLLGYSHMLENR